MSTVIKIENLSKKYIIGHQRQEKYTALRDVMAHKIKGIGQRLRHPLSPNREETNHDGLTRNAGKYILCGHLRMLPVSTNLKTC